MNQSPVSGSRLTEVVGLELKEVDEEAVEAVFSDLLQFNPSVELIAGLEPFPTATNFPPPYTAA
jgi:hypothetical protein